MANKINPIFNLEISQDELNKRIAANAKRRTKKHKTKGGIFFLLFLLIVVTVCTCLWFVLGKNDTFELIGENQISITLTKDSSFVDEGVKLISFGNDISESIEIETNLMIDENGMYYAVESGDYYIQYTATDFKFGTLFKQKLVRHITIIIDDSTDDSGNTGNTGGDTGGNTGDTGNTGGDNDNTGGDTGNTGGDTGDTGGDTGDTGNTGGDTGDTGNTGGDNGGGDHNDPLTIETANMSIHFLELGNRYTGDCTYIKTPTADILIDCGSRSTSIPTVTNYLNQYVTDGTLEYVIITHAHQDHYAGFATYTSTKSIFDLYECETIITFSQTVSGKTSQTMYKNYLRELKAEIKAGANHYTALDCVNNANGAKSSYEIGENITLTILNSYYYANQSDNENEHSVCTLITDNNKNYLFTGDLEEEGEAELIKLNNLPEVDLYKAGHHGSKTSSSTALMKVIKPKTICVCCCAGSSEYTERNENQFPTQIFVNNVAPYTSEIYVTTLCIDYDNNVFTSFNGNIVYMSSSTGYKVQCSNNNTILKESEWFKNNRTWPSS